MAEFSPPDFRLAGKLTIRKPPPAARLRHVNGGHPVAPSDAGLEAADAEISRLAKLATLDYEHQRKEAAERLDIRAAILDRLVLSERARYQDDGKQGRALSLPAPQPWPESVNGADLLDELSASIRRHVVMQDHAADTAGCGLSIPISSIGLPRRLASQSHRRKRAVARRRHWMCWHVSCRARWQRRMRARPRFFVSLKCNVLHY